MELIFMIGAIIGDIVGSRFEFNNYRKKILNFLQVIVFLLMIV